ncbi:MAG TPA: zinc-binding dehydrogenase [Chloroflexota bacterium]
MKAVVMHEFGGPEVLRFEEVPTPEPGPGEVLVKVGAVSVNRTLDLIVRAGEYVVRPPLPHVLGVDPAGTIAAIGLGVEHPKVDDRVALHGTVRCGACEQCLSGREPACPNTQHLGVHRWGGYAEYICVPARNSFPIPDNLSFGEASVISRHFPTAFNLLENKAQLKSDEWVLIMGAAGALGSCLVQVAKLAGANVIAGAGSDERVRSCLEHRADFGVNYRRQDLASEVMRITEGHGADVVAENIADPTLWPGAFESLAFEGRLVTAGAHGGGTVPLDVKRLYLRRLTVIGSPGSNQRDLARALHIASEGKIHAVIGKVMPLRDAAEAHRILERNEVIGKVILEP